MDDEIKQLLEKNLEVSEKSLSLLKTMRREVVLGRIFHFIKWAVIIGLIIFGLVKIQPYLAYWLQVFANLSAGIQSINGFFQR